MLSFKKLMVISDGVNVTTIWEPEPMRGYSCLGHFATLGSNPPDKSQVACLPTECLVKSNTLAYVASFPAIDIIPSFANKNLKFCSFWSTPLNHLYCKVSTDNYYTSDYDLSKFNANQYGFGVSYTDIFTKANVWKFGIKNVDLRFHQYDRSNGLSAWIVSGAIKFVMQ